MAYDIGPKIGIDGETEFRKQISAVGTQIKTLGTEMKAATAAFDANDKSQEKLTTVGGVLEKQIAAQKDRLDLLKKGLGEATTAWGENDERTQKWAQSVNNAQADLSKLERELENNKDALRDVERGYNDSGEKVDEFGQVVKDAGDETERAGDKAKDSSGAFSAFGDVAKAAAAAVAAAFAAATAAAAEAGKALVSFSADGAAYADDLLTMSVITGISTDKLQEYQYAAELADVSVDTLTGSMAKNIKSMSSAANGSKNVAAAYEQLGVEVTNADGSLRDSDKVYWELIDALGAVENETERDALAMTVLGKSAQDLNPLIDITSAGMQELGEKAYDAGYVMSNETLNRFGEFDNKLQELKTGTTAAKNALGGILLPVLTDLAGSGVDLLGQFASGINAANGDIGKMGDVVSAIIPQAIDRINQYLPTLLGLVGSTLSAIGGAILENLPVIVESASGIITTIVGSITEALPQASEAGVQVLGTLGTALIENAPALIESALTLMTTLTTGIVDNLPMIIESAIKMLTTLMQGLEDNLPIIIPAVVDGVVLIAKTLTEPDNLTMMISSAIELIKALAYGLIDAIPELIAAVPEIITNLVDFLVNNIPLLVETGIELTIGIVEGLIKAIPELIKAIPQIIKSLVDGIGSFVGEMGKVGLNLIKGLWNGIKDAGAWLRDKISGFFGGVVDSIKSFFGISSPSKLMEKDVGRFLAEGIGVGFEKQMKDVTRGMRRSLPGSLAEIAPGIADVRYSTENYNRSANITTPIILDGKVIARSTSRIQWVNGVAVSRNVGLRAPQGV